MADELRGLLELNSAAQNVVMQFGAHPHELAQRIGLFWQTAFIPRFAESQRQAFQEALQKVSGSDPLSQAMLARATAICDAFRINAAATPALRPIADSFTLSLEAARGRVGRAGLARALHTWRYLLVPLAALLMLIIFCVFIRLKNERSPEEQKRRIEEESARLELERKEKETREKAEGEATETRKALVGSYTNAALPGVKLSITAIGLVSSRGDCTLTFKDGFGDEKNECKDGACKFVADDNGCAGSMSRLPDGTLVLTVTVQAWKDPKFINCQACVPLSGQWNTATL